MSRTLGGPVTRLVSGLLGRGGPPRAQARRAGLHVQPLEARDVPCGCNDDHGNHDNPGLAAEHRAVMNLVPCEAATHTAVRTGSWSDPLTWGGEVPGAGANVRIPEGLTVTINSVLTSAVRTIHLDGRLRFDPNRDTRLEVDTIVVDVDGTLEVGTAQVPIRPNVTASIVFDDAGPIDRTWDPRALSRGLISHGDVIMYGSAVTPFVAARAGALTAGATTLTFNALPAGWNAGDTLLIPGVLPRGRGDQDEVVRIAAVSGNTVTFDRPLQFAHLAPVGRPVQVANLTRNVVVGSENAQDIGRRGHVMFMHSDRVRVSGVEFQELGRTNKDLRINDPQLDGNGQLIPGTGTNARGRYAVHVHRTGMGSTPASISKSVVVGSPGWGFVNHSSRVDFADNIGYNVLGAAFATEIGDELGSFVRNLAVRQTGSGDALESRAGIEDWGHGGHGFWFQGGGTRVISNVAAGSATASYMYFTSAVPQQGSVGIQQIAAFSGNSAYASKSTGLEIWTHLLNARDSVRSVVSNFTVWNSEHGISIPYTANVTLRGGSVLGTLSGNAGRTGINSNHLTRSITYEGVRVEGWGIGIQAPQRGTNAVQGGWFNNERNVEIKDTSAPGRVIRISGMQVGTLLSRVNANPADIALVNSYSWSDLTDVFRDQGLIVWNGQRVYQAEQRASFVPFPAGSAPAGTPAALIGKTNRELETQFGLRVGGAVAPDSVTYRGNGRFGAWVGPLNQYVPLPYLVSADRTSNLSGYQLSYVNSEGQRVNEADVTPLVRGWNLITREIGNRRHTFTVFGQ